MAGPVIREADLGARYRDIERRLRLLEVGAPVDVGQTRIVADQGTDIISQVVTSTSPIDVTNSARTFTFKRQTAVLFIATASFAVTAGTDYGYVWGDLDGRTSVKMKAGLAIGGGPSGYDTMTTAFLMLLPKGTHTAKLAASVGPGATSMVILEGAVFVVSTLGT